MVPVDIRQVAGTQVVADTHPAVDTHRVAGIQVVADIHPAVDSRRVAAHNTRPVVHFLTVGHHKDWLAEVVMVVVGHSHHTGLVDSGLDPG